MTTEPLCQEAGDPATPCRFWQTCHESRRRLQHYAGLRGMECWAFVALMDVPAVDRKMLASGKVAA